MLCMVGFIAFVLRRAGWAFGGLVFGVGGCKDAGGVLMGYGCGRLGMLVMYTQGGRRVVGAEYVE